MDAQRFSVTTTVFVNAADAGEAALIIERDLAGRFDADLVSVSAHLMPGDGPCCPACGSERIEHHEDIVARWHFRRVRSDQDGFFDFYEREVLPKL
jgi:hypothetical protein